MSSLSRNWNAWHKKYSYKRSLKHQSFRDFACSYKASKHTYFFLNLLLLLPAALEVLIYEKTYFGGFLFVSFFCVSMTPRSFFILLQNRIFCVNDAKTRPRLNTVLYRSQSVSHCMCNAVWHGFERFKLFSMQSHFNTNGIWFWYTYTIDLIQAEVVS